MDISLRLNPLPRPTVLTLIAAALTSLLLAFPAVADTYIVTTTDDTEAPLDGELSLREAILAANGNPGTDTIQFDIDNATFGAPPHSILVGSGTPADLALPDITDPVTIDGTSEPDFTSSPVVVLDGTAATAGTDRNGIFIQLGGGGSQIRGFVIRDFAQAGIRLYDGNNLIEGNYIGTDASGTVAAGNGGAGIVNSGGSSNEILDNVISASGGDGIYLFGDLISGNGSYNRVEDNFIGTAADGTGDLGNGGSGIQVYGGRHNFIGGNVISNNGSFGVFVFAYYTQWITVQGNLIGTDADGAGSLGNASDGVLINGAWNCTVASNVIGCNGGSGVRITGAGANNGVNNMVRGNYIGTNENGDVLPNESHGVHIDGNVIGTAVGGFERRLPRMAPYSNTIAHNKGDGVFVDGTAAQNSIRANSIFHNHGLGIDIGANGVTYNDMLDYDQGPNDLQNFPALSSAFSSPVGTVVELVLDAPPSVTLLIDFYANDALERSGHGEGRRYLYTTSLTTDPDPKLDLYTVTIPLARSAPKYIPATSTDKSGNTSEFSNLVRVDK